MSGIAGLVFLDGSHALPSQMPAMLLPLRRRGPDRRGTWHEMNAGMGQTLLATTPEAYAELQPWVCAASRCVVVSDSRLDNRDQLAHAVGIVDRHLDQIGDAELLHAGWQKWGAACVDQLLGDFAFAIWDPRQQILFCARDPMGVRPLYIHYSANHLFAFASQPDALLAVQQIPGDLNEGRILDALVNPLEGIDKISTFYRHIERLPPAHTLTLRDGRLSARKYWQPITTSPLGPNAGDAQWIDGLREQFTRAVQRRLRATGAIGSMLSGGLDSSSVVAISSRALADTGRPPLCTFSAVSSDPDCAETLAIRSMLSSFRLDATLLDFRAIPEMLDAIAAEWPALGEPFDASMTLVACQYRAAAAQGVRVMLDGIDADNLLSEGDYLVRLIRQGRLLNAWREAQGQSTFFKGLWSPWAIFNPELRSACAPDALKAIVRRLRGSGQQERKAIKESLVREDFSQRVNLGERLRRLRQTDEPLTSIPQASGARSSMASPFTTAGLERYGRVAAHLGVEPRHPFLDRELIEYCAWIPLNLRLRNGWPKWALRTAMGPLLSQDVAWRRGKEHLGWQFDLALYPRVSTLLGPDSLTDRAALEPYVQLAEIPPWPTGNAVVDPADEHWEAHFAVLALQVWLGRTRLSSDFSDSHPVAQT